MLVLGIETATRTGGVAVVSDTGVLAEYTLNIDATHSERLMATVDRVLSDTGITMRDIEGIAVSAGPGSFTGLRIGAATVKGLAWTTGVPVAAVPTLRALAWNLPFAAHSVCPLLDAKKKEVYAALFRYQNGLLQEEMAAAVLPLSGLTERIAGPVLFTGEGAALFRPALEELFGGRAFFAPRSARTPSAASVAEIGAVMLHAGLRTDPDSLVPIYLRRPEAEVVWEQRRGSRSSG
jgi:tRNA threonylcarbamoyladenosine biosynthesis protein TsaB